MTLLDNELVLKYFGPKEGGIVECCEHEINTVGQRIKRDMSYAILRAMQEPIKKGERYLGRGMLKSTENWLEQTNTDGLDYCELNFHPYALRLPSRFQKQEKKAEDFPECKKEEITWQGYFNGEKIVMTANNVIWLGGERRE